MTDNIQGFIQRWQATSGTERANCHLFLTELCSLLDLPGPVPAAKETEDNDYAFERRVIFQHGDGSESSGFIDLYKRGCFVLEAKQSGKQLHTSGWDNAMLRAHGQAQQYARALPAAEGRPPFIIVTDVGRSIELYSEFTRSGAAYVPYPDPRSHRIRIQDLERDNVRELLRHVWTNPMALDPARQSARVTREIAASLAKLALSLEHAWPAETVAAFLMRCLFTMFAEDVGLLPERSFTELLEGLQDTPQHFPPLLEELWRAMNNGGFSTSLRADLLRFNGGLFADPGALPLDKKQIGLLIEAARADWRHVEPAIFGTLLERALDPVERHKLGAHYTPRAYVERLVMPAIIEPVREEWISVQAAATSLDNKGKHDKAIEEIRGFLHRLCQIRVLDPACGSGNFLYVTLEHLKRLEGEVLNTLEAMGDSQISLDTAGVTVDPHQMLGLETNPRAARIAEAVLWIGFLQWHYRTHGNVKPPEPVLKDFHNIECRDAVLAWDGIDFVADDAGRPVTRWDGRSYKQDPLTGRQVPDEQARVPLEHYTRPRKAVWPQADYVIGNPPFIGTSRMRQALGDGYAEALRNTYPQVPESADYVMYWWQHAADLARAEQIKGFGFITTNSIRQTFNRRVLQQHLEAKNPLSLRYTIPDHPWVDSSDGAAVRIAMTVAQAGEHSGVLNSVTEEHAGQGEGQEVLLDIRRGKLFADLKIGVDFSLAKSLLANALLSAEGVKPHGMGFVVTQEQAENLGLGRIVGLEQYIRPYRNGRDLAQSSREVMIIDLYGLAADEVRLRFPEVYQWVYERVKPDRDAKSHSKDGAAYAKQWWLFGKTRKDMRSALTGLTQYIATVKTSKHRFFQFLLGKVIPDSKLIVFAVEDPFYLGVMSSMLHICWAQAMGSNLGVGNDPTYVKTRCFETFPFPAASEQQKTRIRALAEQLDQHRKRQQALHPRLTLTGMYNVLEKLRAFAQGARQANASAPQADEAKQQSMLSAKEQAIHEQGLVTILRQLHDELDTAVFDAYGWHDLAATLVGRAGGTTPLTDMPVDQAEAEEELLQRLVSLNAERSREEARGQIRWLRPDYQNPHGTQSDVAQSDQASIEVVTPQDKKKQPWPKGLSDQVQAVRNTLLAVQEPLSAEQMARQFARASTPRVNELLQTLESLGQARRLEDGRYVG